MPIYTNSDDYGSDLEKKIDDLIQQGCDSLVIAAGYASNDIIEKYTSKFLDLAVTGSNISIIIGMALFEGLNASTYESLVNLNSALINSNPICGGVKIVWDPRKYHGKIYRFISAENRSYFSGSSNFSKNGLSKNIEFNVEILDSETKELTDDFIGWILSDDFSVNINRIQDFPIKEKIRRKKISHKAINKGFSIDLSKKVINASTPHFDISLSRIDDQKQSSLNAFFGKGRWARSSGKVIPRKWYEVEVIVDVDTTRNAIYPKGDFTAIVQHGVKLTKILCRTQGTNYKNLRSKSSLQILGKWIKGKLEQSGSLNTFELVTSDTLKKYGRDFIRMFKIKDNEYFMEF